MADAPQGPEGPGTEPNLELPSLRLGLRRRKKKDREPAALDAPPSQDPPAPDRTEDLDPSADGDEAPPDRPLAPPPPPPASAGAQPPPPPVPLAVPSRPAEPEPAEPRIPPPPASPVTAAEPDQPAGPLPQATPDLPDDDAVPPRRRRRRRPRTARPPRERRRLQLPAVPGGIAATVIGIVCGLIAVGLAALAADGCATIRGVGGCGSFGLAALVAILAIEVLVGSLLLRLFRVDDPTSTSFLGVGLVAVIAMLFFLDAIDSVWMVLVIPLLSAGAFWLAWWVTATFVEESGD